MLIFNSSKKTFFFGVVALMFLGVCPILTSCTPIESDSIMSALLPNVYVFVAHIVASLVLLTLTI
jgi:hypothetical protein